MGKFEFLKVYDSPFVRPKLKWYFGKIAIGTPYFFPRRWVKPTQQMLLEAAERDIADRKRWNEANEKYGHTLKEIPTIEELCDQKKNYRFPVPKRIGFDFVGLGWKTKWSDTDYRFEWGPVWSFVFFKWQVALFFKVPEQHHYWEAWLYYHYNTRKEKSKMTRIERCKKKFHLLYTVSDSEGERSVNYYDAVLKEKYRDKQ